MWLLDIGNTNIKTYHDGKIEVQKADEQAILPQEKFYYICVNHAYHDRLKKLSFAVDLAPMIALKTDYVGLGVDRQIVCKALKNGVIVDAGSAITIDVMRKGVHQGGCIMLGLHSFEQSFAKISDALTFDLDESIDLNLLPQNTKDALNYATFQAVVGTIERIKSDLPLIFCGGDGEKLLDFFKDASYHDSLVFEGMKEVIKESGC